MDYDRLRELQEKFDENPRRYFAPLANEYRKGGQAKRAIEICRAQLAQMPGHMSGQIVFGQALYEEGEFDEAREVFTRALALDPENLIALRSLGDMSLQSGNTTEARSWYTKLLDADPNDTAVIALVEEIDASSEATPVTPAGGIPGVTADEGNQAIPAVVEETPELQPSSAVSTDEESADPEPVGPTEAPIGLERHYPTEKSSSEASPAQASANEGLAAEDLGVPAGDSAAAGLTSAKQDARSALDLVVPTAAGQEESAPAPSESRPPAREPGATSEETTFTGASAEPFVNETMAQLYLQQGYKQLALKVYRQLSASRPQDAGLKARIAEIEAEDAAAHPGEVAVARKETSVEKPADRPAPRPPSIESPTPGAPPRSEESRSLDRSPIDSPPAKQPSRERESIEAPTRDESRSEPEGWAGRQPSIREFFATLGRRRPPRPASAGGSRPGNNQPGDTLAPLAATPTGASLDTVFAGATVSPSDARAASRLAGAFSGSTGASRTPPTPPMPTPRVNPRVPQAQESEEDVAKFRAWLDGLTGE
ncbi:MAG: tetratricopeptide repeat protein [Gemmatimonadota bacterium]|nr:tetratricopeptide repeat protein [Gemmatimonadota bacterium]